MNVEHQTPISVSDLVARELERRDLPPQKGLPRALGEYFSWFESMGLDVEVDDPADRAAIERFAHHMPDRVLTTPRSWRFLLVDHFQHTRGELQNSDVVPVSMGQRRMVLPPYSRLHERALIVGAPTMRQERVRRAVLGMLTAALGAGLYRRQAEELRIEDLQLDEAGWWVEADGDRFPLRRSLEPIARRLSEMPPHPSGLLLGASPNGAAWTRQPVDGIGVDARRLRATWILRQLEAGVRFDVVARWAGLRTIALQHYLPFLPPPAESVDLDRLRAS